MECKDAAYCYTHVAWSVCLPVEHNRKPHKTDKPIEVPFGIWTRVGPWTWTRNHVLGGARISQGKTDYGGAHCDASFRQNSLTTSLSKYKLASKF